LGFAISFSNPSLIEKNSNGFALLSGQPHYTALLTPPSGNLHAVVDVLNVGVIGLHLINLWRLRVLA
jgi:hypothetical protein